MKLSEVAEKTYYVVDVQWSQTDKDTYIVSAGSKDEAEKKVKDKFPQARYVNSVRSGTML